MVRAARRLICPSTFAQAFHTALVRNFMMELFGFDYVGWSSYDTSVFVSINCRVRSRSGEVINPRNYYNTPTFRLLVNTSPAKPSKYAVDYSTTLCLEARYTQPILPDANRLGVTAGVGINVTDNLVIDALYVCVWFAARSHR